MKISEKAPTRPPFLGGWSAKPTGGLFRDRAVSWLQEPPTKASHTIGEVPEGRRGVKLTGQSSRIDASRQCGHRGRSIPAVFGGLGSGRPTGAVERFYRSVIGATPARFAGSPLWRGHEIAPLRCAIQSSPKATPQLIIHH